MIMMVGRPIVLFAGNDSEVDCYAYRPEVDSERVKTVVCSAPEPTYTVFTIACPTFCVGSLLEC